jgi:predicted nucleic acid-binding protein
MTIPRFLDTNILLYSISRDPTEATKHDRAVALIEAGNNALSVQVLQEFYVQATRPTRPDPLPHEIAAGLIRTWLRFKVQDISVPVMIGALEIKAAYSLSYWDAAIVAAARALGCRELYSEDRELYSEDMSHGREVDGVTIINPFRSSLPPL